ncbi:hypothetical protein E3P81_03412 [Wallemia ichthyophaga]|uniref:Uncharacterized protein n=2 Tax=Wallemia ichthyophaga TaxID=245174 RepID=A0A4T0FMD7_WALIC|nr:uncharacterized protein J056_000950 [Wallemia ichthyophaga EXF-994]TIA88634.1 hypothetical protein E3P97_03449 [Wallemia ichthyophaga]EOR00412.1 hypothetical protein J056_000950 [Wallemia ichthyophaga EXF-994]TIB27814.1 hypothetical protein E3P85_04047 [Wallemia ichthyophaga]TIB31343.1 hypothetical protein E3P86_03338 [Wallemia ichthyophaga]TIB44768.1 hypothetical protein E3P82_03417 [Wallemia ichthyophaga]
MSFVYALIFQIYTLNAILSSYRALKKNSERDKRVQLSERRRQISSWLQIWICWFIWLKLGNLVDYLLSWIWFYWQIKTFILLTFILTSRQSASALFIDALKPTLMPYEYYADGFFALLEDTHAIGMWVLTDIIYRGVRDNLADVGVLRHYLNLAPATTTAPEAEAGAHHPPNPKKKVVRRPTGPIIRQRKNMIANSQKSQNTQSKTGRPSVVLRRPQSAKTPELTPAPAHSGKEEDAALINTKPTFMSTPKAKALHASGDNVLHAPHAPDTLHSPYIPGRLPHTPPFVRLTRSQTRGNANAATAPALTATSGDKGGDSISSSSSSSSSSGSEEDTPPAPPHTHSIANMDRKRNASSASLKSASSANSANSAKSAQSNEQPSYTVLRRADPSSKTSGSGSGSDGQNSGSDSDSSNDNDSDSSTENTKMLDQNELATTHTRTYSSTAENKKLTSSNIPRKKRIVTLRKQVNTNAKPNTNTNTDAQTQPHPPRRQAATRGRGLRRPPIRGRGRGRAT